MAKTTTKKKKAASGKKTSAAAKKPTAASGKKAPKKAESTKHAAAAGGTKGIRVRMYRVGFGDFFLLTVPGNGGPAHILIDCGVHAANIGSIGACVDDLIAETGGRVAVIVLTHYHADHMSGFASKYDDLVKLDVGAVWITNRLDPKNDDHSGFMEQVTRVAQQLRMRLAARTDEMALQALAKAENALGADATGNAKALQLLRSGFKSKKTPVFYYQGGDKPFLPPELEGKIEVEILAPSPKDSGGLYSQTDNKKEQYLSALASDGLGREDRLRAFEDEWERGAYPPEAFDEFDSGNPLRGGERKKDGAKIMEGLLEDMQPDELAAAADALDGTLNNQSLVLLVTVAGKKLLFVGDAQWGNWSYWLYERAVTGKDPGITERAKKILGGIDFYKVGHHGSTNANPIPAVAALSAQCAAMCSTGLKKDGDPAYGDADKGTEVPRTVLLSSLVKRLGPRVVRSDWVPVPTRPADPAATKGMPTLPKGFSTPGQLFIDFNL